MVAAGVAAQLSSEDSGSSSASPTSTATSSAGSATSSANATIHTVTVGEGGYNKFVPNATLANAGDIIQFLFYPSNHSVVKAQEGYPCIPYDTMNPGKASFFSGFEYVPQVRPNVSRAPDSLTLLRTILTALQPPSFNLTVNDTNPVYFYCSAPGSCTGFGMIGVINPENATSVDIQAAKALESGSIMLHPGESFPSEDTSSTLAAIATATLTTTVVVPSATNGSTVTSSTSTTASNAAAATASAEIAAEHHLSGGAIAGIVIAGVGILGLLGALVWFMSRSRTLRQTLEQRGGQGSESQQTPTGDKSDGSRWSTATTGMLPPYSGSSPISPQMAKMERVGSPAHEGYYAYELPSKEEEERTGGARVGYR